MRTAGTQRILLSVSKRGRDHLPLKVLVELLTEAVDAGPVQLLVEGVRGSVCRKREGPCGLAKGSLPLSLPTPAAGIGQ